MVATQPERLGSRLCVGGFVRKLQRNPPTLAASTCTKCIIECQPGPAGLLSLGWNKDLGNVSLFDNHSYASSVLLTFTSSAPQHQYQRSVPSCNRQHPSPQISFLLFIKSTETKDGDEVCLLFRRRALRRRVPSANSTGFVFYYLFFSVQVKPIQNTERHLCDRIQSPAITLSL